MFAFPPDSFREVISAGEMNSSHLRVMRFARLARALRGVRVIRLLRYVSSLRTIVPLGRKRGHAGSGQGLGCLFVDSGQLGLHGGWRQGEKSGGGGGVGHFWRTPKAETSAVEVERSLENIKLLRLVSPQIA